MTESRKTQEIEKARDKGIHGATAAGFEELRTNQPVEKHLGSREMKEIWKNLKQTLGFEPPEPSESL